MSFRTKRTDICGAETIDGTPCQNSHGCSIRHKKRATRVAEHNDDIDLVPNAIDTGDEDVIALNELMSNISYDIKQSVDPLFLITDDNPDNLDEARVAALSGVVGKVAGHVGDSILSGHDDVDGFLESELREIVAVCALWLEQITERTTSEILEDIKWTVPTAKPFTQSIHDRPLPTLISCLGQVMETMPSTDLATGPRHHLMALATQSVRWILKL